MPFVVLALLVLATIVVIAVFRIGGREREGAAVPAGEGDVAARLDAFWDWWRKESPRIAAALDAGRGASTVDELSERILAIDPSLAWETGPGLKGARHHLALSAEGDTGRRVLVERWLARAPAPDAAWEYYSARQASGGDAKRKLTLNDSPDVEIDYSLAGVVFETDAAREVVHVRFHHPALAKLPEEARTRIAFLLLDDALGEDGVERWIGGIEVSVDPLPDAKPVRVLADAVASLAKGATGEHWAMIEGRTPAGHPLLAMVNVALKRVDHLLMDWHLEVTMPFEAAGGQGLPSGAENETLNRLEDELVASLGHDAVNVGHETGDGRRTIHFHVASHGPAEARTRAWAGKHPERHVEIELRHDPAWEVLSKWR